MNHPIERHTTDADDHIDYGYARNWLRVAVFGFALWVVLGLAGFVITVDTVVQWSDSPALDEVAVAAGAKSGPPMSTTSSSIGFLLFLGAGFMAIRTGRQIVGVLDPMAAGKLLDSRGIEIDDEPQDPIDKTVSDVDAVIQKRTDKGWVRAEESIAG